MLDQFLFSIKTQWTKIILFETDPVRFGRHNSTHLTWLRAFVCVITGNLVTFAAGAACGWCGPNFIVLTQDTTPLPSGPLTVSEGSLVVSLLAVGAIIGTVVNAIYLDKCGRKILLAFMSICQIVRIVFDGFFVLPLFWWTDVIICVYFWLDELGPYNDGSECHLFVPVEIIGWICSWRYDACCSRLRFRSRSRQVKSNFENYYWLIEHLLSTVICFLSLSRVRGTLGSLLILSCNAGMLFAFIIADYFSYFAQLKIQLAVSILYLVVFTLFPESPEYFMKLKNPEVLFSSTSKSHSTS